MLILKINQNRRLAKFLEDKDRKKLEEEKKQETKKMSRIVSFDLERTCGPEDSEIIQLSYCTKTDQGNSFIFPRGEIDKIGSKLSHKMYVQNSKLKRNKVVLNTVSMKKAAEQFIQFLVEVKSKVGSPILVCHGTDYTTLLNNFAPVDFASKVCEIIEGVINFKKVVDEDENYPSSSSKSLVKVTEGGKKLSETVLGQEFSREEHR